MYYNVLFIHSWLRWIIVITLSYVLLRSIYAGWIAKSEYTKSDNILAVILLGCTHIQVLIGFWLYFFLSPLTTMPAPSNFMKNSVLRYWKVEHIFIMIVFLILIQVGRSISKRKQIPVRKHKVIAIFAVLAFGVLMLGMPWPNKPYGKPLFDVKTSTTSQSHNI